MKWTFLLLSILLCGISNAQNSNASTATVFIGLSPQTGLIPKDTLLNIDKNTSKAVIGLSYYYKIQPRFNFGIIASYHNVPFSISSLTGNETGVFHVRYLGLLGKYSWFKKQNMNFSFSSGIGLGYDYSKKKYTWHPANNLSPIKKNQSLTQLRLSISLVEAKIKLTDNIQLIGELSLGAPTSLSLGAGYVW